MGVRGIRGATTADGDSPEAILQATRELLRAMTQANAVDPADLAAAFFTTTLDLTAEFPAAAARQLDWPDVPTLCGHEMAVPAQNARALPRCIRVLLLWNTERPPDAIRAVYLRGARVLEAERAKP